MGEQARGGSVPAHAWKNVVGGVFCLSGSSHLFRYVHKASVGTYYLQLRKTGFKTDL